MEFLGHDYQSTLKFSGFRAAVADGPSTRSQRPRCSSHRPRGVSFWNSPDPRGFRWLVRAHPQPQLCEAPHFAGRVRQEAPAPQARSAGAFVLPGCAGGLPLTLQRSFEKGCRASTGSPRTEAPALPALGLPRLEGRLRPAPYFFYGLSASNLVFCRSVTIRPGRCFTASSNAARATR